jgi:uncharacterized protein involved in response to NO
LTVQPAHTHKPVPRGLSRTGPVILSYGFRPFFLAAGIWGMAAMGLWVAALVLSLPVGGELGGAAWHAHEMLFGYTSAALAGFLLTAIPNWTGRLPVSGMPLLVLFSLWCLGRATLLFPELLGNGLSFAVDALFLPALLVICSREIITGRKWKDLKILAGLAALSLANIAFHVCNYTGVGIEAPSRLAIGAYLTLIMIVGGRILPSFTRNWLAKRGETRLPAPYDRFDAVTILVGVGALGLWWLWPEEAVTGAATLVAAALHAIRLCRWRGWQTPAEGLLAILHVAYGFVVLGFLAIAATAFGLLDMLSSLHVLTVGAIGTMTLAVMSRATRGHTGLELHASALTVMSYVAMVLAGLLRPLAAFLPEQSSTLVAAAGLCWTLAFALYLLEYAPPLLRKRRELPMKRGEG